MRIVIDLQGAQSSNSRNRGIGRYTMSLLLTMISNIKNHEIVVVLNGNFPKSIQPIRDAISNISPERKIEVVVWQPPKNVAFDKVERCNIRKSVEILREAFLINLNPSVILITSLFEGCDDDAITSISRLNTEIPTSVILYDLIPLINNHLYLANDGIFSKWYFEKIRHLKSATQLIAISESSRQEAIDYLGFHPENVVNISTAADSHFKPLNLNINTEKELRAKYGLYKSFVMYTGGIERRKNIDKLITSYAKLPKKLRSELQLAIVCSASEFDKNRLSELASKSGLHEGDLILTGYVAEDDLVALYNLCKVFIFPSWHEGFGLPALEAMSCGAAVIAANTSSLPEVIGMKEALFNPHSEADITAALEKALTDEQFRTVLKTHGLERAKAFTWKNTAITAISALEKIAQPTEKPISTTKPRLAYLSPLPPERSGISDYSAELLPYLARYYNIDVICTQESVSSVAVKTDCTIRSVEWFATNRDLFDRVLYHFGNSHFHEHMHALIRIIPGVVVLHDFYLSNFLHHYHLSNPTLRVIERSMYNSHGYKSLKHCSEHHWSNAEVTKYPCSYDAIRESLGVIVHSQNSSKLASEWYAIEQNSFDTIPLLRIASRSDLDEKRKARDKLGINHTTHLVCSFGFAAPTKLSVELYAAWVSSTLADDPDCMLVYVGDRVKTPYGETLDSLIRDHNKASRVILTGWADEQVFRDYLNAADVGVQLRTMSRGETSAAVLDCMNYGLATIVNSNGSMAELPESAVYMLADEFSPQELVTALDSLKEDSAKRSMLGSIAKEYVRTIHNPEKCASEYFQSIEKSYSNMGAGVTSVNRAISNEVSLTDIECMEVANTVDSMIRPKFIMRQYLIDVSEMEKPNYVESLEKRNRLRLLLESPPQGYRTEPMYFCEATASYKYARDTACSILGISNPLTNNEDVRFNSEDMCALLDEVSPGSMRDEALAKIRNSGLKIIDLFSEDVSLA